MSTQTMTEQQIEFAVGLIRIRGEQGKSGYDAALAAAVKEHGAKWVTETLKLAMGMQK
jgi:hypothetical protein